MAVASGRPDSRMSVEASSFDAASTCQVRLRDAHLDGLMEEQRGDPSHQEEETQKNPTFLRLRSGPMKENLLSTTPRLQRNPLHTESVLQLTGKARRIRKRHGTIVFNYRYTQINLRML